jgi:hypothetical protein
MDRVQFFCIIGIGLHALIASVFKGNASGRLSRRVKNRNAEVSEIHLPDG